MRLDAADQSWHLSTPTPYDPPLTYGGWNQCRALGVRIASLLQSREQSTNTAIPAENEEDSTRSGAPKRKRRKHKVVIHSSPFQRCLETSVAIAAGLAQHNSSKYPSSKSSNGPSKASSAQTSTISSRIRNRDGLTALTPVIEQKAERNPAKKTSHETKRYRKSKLRVDAFLGEWLNPQYFDQITPPPPSPMMVASAKAELMQNDPIDVFIPSAYNKTSGGSLWGGATGRPASRESTLDDWSHVTSTLPAPTPRRDRASSVSSVGSNESSSGRKSPFRPGHVLQPFTSTVPKPNVFFIYVPPTPTYAVLSAGLIPRGYVAHARNACVDVDYQWDSSRPPQDWGDSGEYGEEWSAMHKRLRKGLNGLMQWYSQHDASEREDEAPGDERSTKREHSDEQEELVVILVTHGAGCNALIGALTNQPVLLDVGMASLTMAVRKDDAPSLLSVSTENDPKGSHHESGGNSSGRDMGLASIYEMKIVSSSEHLRPGSNPTKAPALSLPRKTNNGQDAIPKYQKFGSTSHAAAGAAIKSTWDLGEPARNNTSKALGSIRRPSLTTVPTRLSSPGHVPNNGLMPIGNWSAPTTPPTFTTGLWTPPPARNTPTSAKTQQKKADSSDTSKTKDRDNSKSAPNEVDYFPRFEPSSQPDGLNTRSHAAAEDNDMAENDELGALPSVSEKLPQSLSRGLSQKGLWGNKPTGDQVPRKFGSVTKRRWTVSED